MEESARAREVACQSLTEVERTMPAMTYRGWQEGCWLPSRTGSLAGFLWLRDSALPETETQADTDTGGTGPLPAWPPEGGRQIVVKQ